MWWTEFLAPFQDVEERSKHPSNVVMELLSHERFQSKGVEINVIFKDKHNRQCLCKDGLLRFQHLDACFIFMKIDLWRERWRRYNNNNKKLLVLYLGFLLNCCCVIIWTIKCNSSGLLLCFSIHIPQDNT